MKKKIVLINARNLSVNGGDKLLSYSLLKLLSEIAEVVYINIIDETIDEKNYMAAIQSYASEAYILQDELATGKKAMLKALLSTKPYFISRRKYKNKISSEVARIINTCSPDVILWDHIRTTAYFKPTLLENKQAKHWLLQHNNETFIYKQKIDKIKSRLLKLVARSQVYNLYNYTKKLSSNINKCLYLTANDVEDVFANKYYTFQHVYIDVDCKYVDKNININKSQINLLFVGALDWYPNYDGIVWFYQNVFKALPESYRLFIIGRNASVIESVVCNNPRVVVKSNVPDLVEYYNNADIFIAPILNGSGINVKIGEAASYGKMIVGTSYSFRGYGNQHPFIVADDANSFLIALQHAKIKIANQHIQNDIIEWYQKYKQASISEWQKLLSNT
ncbi:MAG: glycosyltransferase [Chitinophagaceae bacterium]